MGTDGAVTVTGGAEGAGRGAEAAALALASEKATHETPRGNAGASRLACRGKPTGADLGADGLGRAEGSGGPGKGALRPPAVGGAEAIDLCDVISDPNPSATSYS